MPRLSVHVTNDKYERIRAYCFKENKTKQDLLAESVTEYLDRWEADRSTPVPAPSLNMAPSPVTVVEDDTPPEAA